MKRRVILPLLLAAVAHSGFANTHQKPGSTFGSAIHATRYPNDSDVRSTDAGRTWTVAIYFSTKFHGRRTMYFKTTWRHLTGK